MKALPPPYDQIKISHVGTIIGKAIYMTGALRIKKAIDQLEQVSRKIFRNNAFNRKIKILLWNSLIRSTMIYGIHTKAPPVHLVAKIEIYMYKHLRMMMGPQWKIEEWYPGKPTLQETAAFED